MVADFSSPQEFFPEQLPRRGEIIAWALALIVTLTAVIVQADGSRWTFIAWVLVSVLLLSAASISLGNWMDRHTIIRVDRTGVTYTNGIRYTALAWDEIQAIRVLPAQWEAQQVQVIGETPRGKHHFEFRTLGAVNFQGQERGRTGFSEGDQILKTILRMANMQPVPSDHPSYAYYARK